MAYSKEAIAAANKRASARLARTPTATAARYDRRSGRPEATGRAGRSHAAAALPRAGSGLVPFGRPWIDKKAVV